MCTRPITKDENTFACRSCDACIAVRRAGWVSRAMAEKVEWNYALVLALTYSDETQENRDAAAMFAYADVRAFLKRLAAACREIQPGAKIRFLCAGEQGDQNNRCHWHLIVYSDLDITRIGKVTRFGKVLQDREDMLTKGRKKIRLLWSTWGKGFVTMQEANQGAMAYVLSYCLKDQFSAEKSEGTMRYAKSENFATGLFRMSKRPAIGERWLMRKMEGLDASGSVLPNLQLKVDDMPGYWHPNGSFRQKLLWSLVALNQRAVWATGRNAPQWAALLSACNENETDMEILLGPQIEDLACEDEISLESKTALAGAEWAARASAGRAARRCGNLLPCTKCLDWLSERDLKALGLRYSHSDDAGERSRVYHALEGCAPVAIRQSARGGGINVWCREKAGDAQKRAFPASSRS